jgi:hypothetical protein
MSIGDLKGATLSHSSLPRWERNGQVAKEALVEYKFTKKQKRDTITKQKALLSSQKAKLKKDMGQSRRMQELCRGRKNIVEKSSCLFKV